MRKLWPLNFCVYVCVCMCSVAQLCPTLCDLTDCSSSDSSVGFSRQEYWSGLPFPPTGDLPNPGIETMSLASPALVGGLFTTEPSGKPLNMFQFSSVQSLSRVRLFVTPWIAARQASLSITNSRSSLRLTSIESVMPSSHLILCRPLLLPPMPLSIGLFQWVNSLHEVAKVLELQL